MISGQGTLIRLQAACIRELENGDTNNGRLLWRASLPAERHGSLASPSFHTHCHGYKVRLVLDTTDEQEVSLYMETVGPNPTTCDFEGECHVTIFDQSRQLDTYKQSFPVSFRSKNSRNQSNEGEKPGIYRFMPIEDLFSAPFARADSVLILAEVKPNIDL